MRPSLRRAVHFRGLRGCRFAIKTGFFAFHDRTFSLAVLVFRLGVQSRRRRSLLTCVPLRTGHASWPRIRLKHEESPSFKEPAPRYRSRRMFR